MLRTALGPAIASFLEDPSIVEVMLNPDGRLWIDRLSGGLEDSGVNAGQAYVGVSQDRQQGVQNQRHDRGAPADTTDERTQGDLADDLADIYRDIKPGLTAWNTGDDAYLEDIFYQWLQQGHIHHWGRHAVNAMRALHWLVYK